MSEPNKLQLAIPEPVFLIACGFCLYGIAHFSIDIAKLVAWSLK